MLPDLASLAPDLPSFIARFSSDAACREHLARLRWPEGFRCQTCGPTRCYAHKKRLIYECDQCGKQHSLLAGTVFEQTKTGLSKWFLAIYLFTTSKGGIAAAELKRHLGFGSDQTAWVWQHKLRRAMVDPARKPLEQGVEVDEALIGGPKPGKRGRGAAGKVLVAIAVETRSRQVTAPSEKKALRGIAKTKADALRARLAEEARQGQVPGLRRCLGRVRMALLANASAKSLDAFLATAVAPGAKLATDGFKSYAGLADKGYEHAPVVVSKSAGKAHEYLPAVHLVIALLKRWLAGTHHGGVSPRHLQRYLDEYAFRFNRRTAAPVGRVGRLIERAMATAPASYADVVGNSATRSIPG